MVKNYGLCIEYLILRFLGDENLAYRLLWQMKNIHRAAMNQDYLIVDE